jgi:hypothetical protein
MAEAKNIHTVAVGRQRLGHAPRPRLEGVLGVGDESDVMVH